jgi:pyrimidine-nucleoside phosphorylase
LRAIGLVIAGQTAELAPADKALYALRDVTGTVPSLPLIAASIMSKKLAAGADAIVLDVKCGRGAFMETLEDARALSHIMVGIGREAGRRVTALVTQMEQPLGRAVGHALEVQEAIATLHGNGPADFQELVELTAGEMLLLGQGTSRAEGRAQVREAITSGAAFAKFRAFVEAQGGDVALVDDPARLPAAPVVQPLLAPAGGYVQHIDARAVGLAVVEMGGGRHQKGDPIDHRVGVTIEAKVGSAVQTGDHLCTIHAATDDAAERAAAHIIQAYTLGPEHAAPLPVLLDRIEA